MGWSTEGVAEFFAQGKTRESDKTKVLCAFVGGLTLVGPEAESYGIALARWTADGRVEVLDEKILLCALDNLKSLVEALRKEGVATEQATFFQLGGVEGMEDG